MTKIRPAIEFTLLLGFAALASGQTAPSVTQTATQSPCANIVALSGAKVDCSNLTLAQKKALSDIPSILKMALENQNYLEEIMKKLNEMSMASPAQPSVVCKDNANCGVSTGQTGGITAGQIVNSEPIEWYEWNGAFHRRQGNTFGAIAGAEMSERIQMEKLEDANDWTGVKALAESAIAKYPSWPTPLFKLAYAESQLCQIDAAINSARTFISQATLAAQFTKSYDERLQIMQNDLNAMLSGKWPSSCH